ncbi:hypothetical protein ABWK22_02865 [Gottfriedia acidiceleris]|uniref:hypothetical protein n=1 Tax=Gottfriedia acidiceleris TaxID=371036 RepID=UPI0033997227
MNNIGLGNGFGFEGYSDRDSYNDGYPQFETSLQTFFDKAVSGDKPLFTTNVTGLFDVFINNLPEHARQHYTCRCCEQFIERFGGLVTINENGTINTAIWDVENAPDFFVHAVSAMKVIVNNSKVNGVFIPDARVLGTPKSGSWTHLHVRLPQSMVNRSIIRTAYQVAAEKREDFKMLIRALLDFPTPVVEQALAILQSDALYRSEKILGVAKWFNQLHEDRSVVKNSRLKENITWLAVANAPAGFCHVRSSMIGTLLEDIADGMSFDSVSRRFKEKMRPDKYQRPQAPPKAGNIVQAEKIVQQLGIENSLVRRFARLDELHTLWRPANKKEPVRNGSGLFSHLQPKNNKPVSKMVIPETTMTWRKFFETVIPTAEEIEFKVKSTNDNYSAILTAEHADAPPILQWDTEEQRNPFSWYVYNFGSSYTKWGLTPGYTKVTGITLQPSMWYGDYANQGKSVFFILDGARDKRSYNAGNALFPETLKSELREIRSTIEAYSKGETIHRYEDASACGVRLQAGSNWDATVRVTTKTGTAIYKLDRWD